MDNFDNYYRIIKLICMHKGINESELSKLLKDKECKYLMLLLMKKYGYIDMEKLRDDFSIKNKKSINYGFKKAEEKLFINKNFRDLYFKINNLIDNAK